MNQITIHSRVAKCLMLLYDELMAGGDVDAGGEGGVAADAAHELAVDVVDVGVGGVVAGG